MTQPAKRPVVGLTTYREDARWGVWAQRADVLHIEYADAVVAAGGVPVLLPPAAGVDSQLAAEVARAVVGRLDAVVITGGADVDPASYGEEPHAATRGWREDRDRWELALLGAAERLPVLGVCRGMQLMAVAGGGSLHQHTPEVVGHEQHSPGADEFGTIPVRTEPDSLVSRIVGPETTAHCHHHQSVRLHPGFVATAWADDGTVEAMEAEDPDRFCLAVQWHPEMSRDLALFEALVEAAR